ncbi:PREDICTED: zinc finger CCCH domain-containing protein 18-like [Elephantulus edwardii]|uniref:zinc finger CCCH domain-containing protein 18-like n=1 Tax=Elephantulus edwardii TaxID=28737 RepID=UPI0003F0DB4C|nr:PREDICTED: zinc finger CCCH domain-containing protein 18-like [Elephantulus edwardii]
MPAAQEDGAERAGAEGSEEKGEGAREEEDPSPDAVKEKKEDDDGEIEDGEIEDDDLEEGEVKDPSDKKVRPRPTCRFFMKGNCTWGMNCMFIHPGINDKGNYSLITKAEPFPPNGSPPLGPPPLMPADPWGCPVVDEILPPPPPAPATQIAWERGLWHAKEVSKKADIRKEQEPDLEEKRLTVTIGEDEREFDKENEVFQDWNYRITRDVRDTALEPYTDPYCDYEIERFQRGGQYENLRVQSTETDPYSNYRDRDQERKLERWQREQDRDKERQRQKKEREHWERDKEKVKPRSPKKETASAGPQVKQADEWKDPWCRSRSPKKKLGVSVSPSRARRHRKTSVSSASASSSSRSSSRSSYSYSSSSSSSSRSHSKSSSYSSYSRRSSRHSSFSGSRSRSSSSSSSPSPSPHRPTIRAKGKAAPQPGKVRRKLLKKRKPPPALPQATKTTAHILEPPKRRDPRKARRKQRQARTPLRRRTRSSSSSGSRSSYSSYRGSSSRSRSRSVSSVSSVSSATSSRSSVRSVDSEDMYADLPSPVSSASSGSPTPAQSRKEKAGKDVIKKKRKRDWSAQCTKAGSQSSQQTSTPQQARPGQPAPATFIAPKKIKLTLLDNASDKAVRKRCEPSDKDRPSPPPAKRATLSPDRASRYQKSGGRLGSPQPERQRGQNPKAPSTQPDRKRQLWPPQAKGSSKVTCVPGKAGAPGLKAAKASTLSRREELLQQLKAIEDAIALKRAKIAG